MDIITIENLTKQYDDLTAVESLNLTIGKGEIFGLLGPNGAGKTTLLMMLSTLIKPTSGNATINGFSILTQPEKVRNSIGMVFQDPSSDELLTGYENLKLHALMYDVPWKFIDSKIDSALGIVDMLAQKDKKVKTYSGGMRRRMEIARGLIHKPEVMFLDEPTIGLDPQTREHIWQYIESLAKKSGMTIMLTTHYMEEAEKLCDRIAIIDHGKIVALDSPSDLINAAGGDIVLLKGKNLNTEELKKLPYIKKMNNSEENIELEVENAGKNLKEILSVAGEVTYVEMHSPNLNDVFLNYTGREIRTEEGGTMERIRALSNAK